KDLAVPGNEMLEDYVWTFTAVEEADCLEPVALNAAAPFGSFGGSAGVTNDGLLTIINGDIGSTGASTLITGFVGDPECRYTITTSNEGLVNGRIYTDAPVPPNGVDCTGNGTAVTKAIADQARSDANDAFIALSPAALPGGATQAENLGGLTLAPGIYTAAPGSFLIEGGNLTLDGQGDQNAVWVFQMASTLTVGEAAVSRSVILTNGAQAKNVFWQVGTAATINPAGGGTMVGTIIAESGVAISTTGNNTPILVVTLDGRALSLTSAVTITNTIINVPAP
ncbi:MAG: ice-binding family protein, partial [Natronospirillum sp.]